jgi:hypothetical protein
MQLNTISYNTEMGLKLMGWESLEWLNLAQDGQLV